MDAQIRLVGDRHLTVLKPLLRLVFSGDAGPKTFGSRLGPMVVSRVHPPETRAIMPVTHRPIRRRTLRTLGVCVALLVLSGCLTKHTPSGEEYELPSLRVVFLDAPQIQAKWQEVTGKSAVMMTPRLVLDTHRREEVVVGFYDFRTRTIYCPKMDFEVCGHELHHAVLGRFHLEE